MEQKVVLITGGSGGIGQATAWAFAKAGYKVGIHYNSRKETAEQLVSQLSEAGYLSMLLQADLSNQDQVMSMVDSLLEKWGKVDTLVCNAGVSWTGLLRDMTQKDWETLRGVNLDGVLYSCQAVYPHMVSSKSGQIITISSMWGRVGASCEVAYSATKAGVIGLSKALAQELGPCGVTVNCVCPGVIDTEMNGHLSVSDKTSLAEETPLGRLGTPEDVAKTLVFLASESAGFITGQVLGVDGGFVIG